MRLAIFDLDNTLIAGDSDYLWAQYLVENGLVEAESYRQANEEFYEQYRAGCLDIAEFLRFALKPLAANAPESLYAWRADFIERKIKPILLPAAQALIDRHRAAGDVLMVITATNHFLTEPIVELYGIEHLIATRPEFRDGRFTGQFEGTPCFQAGKVERLRQWLEQRAVVLQDSWFYSDSHNDLPLLSQVGNPVAVDPDDTLLSVAMAKGWPVLSLRG